ncbi:MAG: amidophosphoribosyltransferase [Planctomycetota bacterium]
MCGFIGFLGPDSGHAVQIIYDGLIALQHRGQDAGGIITFNGAFHLHKGGGLIRDIFDQPAIDRLKGPVGIGHVRYPTWGGGSHEDAQPFLVQHPYGIAIAHNGQVTNFDELKDELIHKNRRHINSGCDVEVILHVLADELDHAVKEGTEPTFAHIKQAVAGVHRRVKGAYSVVAMVAGVGLIAFRDPHGIRPMVVGTKVIDGQTCVLAASESVILDFAGFTDYGDLAAGEMLFVDFATRTVRREVLPTAKAHRPCIFEFIYFARPDGLQDNISVYHARIRNGATLAEAWRRAGAPTPDVIMPVPDSARPAAIEMAVRLGVKYREGLIKNRYIGRTFIMPGNQDRRRAVRTKLNTVRHAFEGRDVLLVDDSIVRGNTIKELIQMARNAGARKVYFASYAAPLKFPCVYGIDMSTKRDFIARDRSTDEVRDMVGADYLLYQSIEDMVEATRPSDDGKPEFCTACFTGEYPTGDVPADVLAHFEAARTS